MSGGHKYEKTHIQYIIQFTCYNSNKSPTRCNNFPGYYPDVYLQLNMFRAFSRPSSGAQWLQWQPLVLPSYPGDSRAVFVVGPAGPTTNTACWAVNKPQDNKLENCCIWLVIYLNCTMMHGLTNLKFKCYTTFKKTVIFPVHVRPFNANSSFSHNSQNRFPSNCKTIRIKQSWNLWAPLTKAQQARRRTYFLQKSDQISMR